MTKTEKQLQIAIETRNFITAKRDNKFYQVVAERFKSWTMWFPGCVVHHWDENPCNNHPLNLGCMTRKEHNKLHKTGKKHSIETKLKMSKSAKIKIFSDKHKANMSKARKGFKNSEASKIKMRTNGKGKNSKQYVYNNITYKSIIDAADAIGITKGALYRRIYTEKKRTIKSFSI